MYEGGCTLKRAEKVLIKLIIIQFLFLVLSQLFFHQFDVMPELNQLTKYEGVNEYTFTEILQTFRGK